MAVGLFSLVSVAILVGIFLAISDDAKFENDMINGTVKNITTESEYFYFTRIFLNFLINSIVLKICIFWIEYLTTTSSSIDKEVSLCNGKIHRIIITIRITML